MITVVVTMIDIVVSISTTTAIVYALSCSFFFLLILLLVCMGLEPSQRLVQTDEEYSQAYFIFISHDP